MSQMDLYFDKMELLRSLNHIVIAAAKAVPTIDGSPIMPKEVIDEAKRIVTKHNRKLKGVLA